MPATNVTREIDALCRELEDQPPPPRVDNLQDAPGVYVLQD